MVELATQYNQFADDFSKNHDIGENSNRLNREVFYSHIDFITPGTKLLDLGCGDGTDLAYYRKKGADAIGLDASINLLGIAKKNFLNKDRLIAGYFENLPFMDNRFDAVLSKYALMTSANLKPIFEETHRVLKPGGTMLYLVTHPFRQYFERREEQGNYFEQTIVDSHILGNTVTVQEPTHTMGEYLTPSFLQKFDIQAFDERFDPAAEKIDGKQYPGFFILKAKKR